MAVNWFVHFMGTLLLILAGGAAGMMQAAGYRNRRRLLEDYLRLLLIFEGGICSKRLSLPLLWGQLLLQKESFSLLPIKEHQGDIKQTMRSCLCESEQVRRYLSRTDRRLLGQWIDELGSGTVEQEQNRLQFLRQLLMQSKEQALATERQNTKVSLSLGVCAGLAVAVLTL